MLFTFKKSILVLASMSLPFVALQCQDLKWDKKLLTIDSHESCALGYLNGDGALDVVVGRHWYCGKNLVPRSVETMEDNKGYVDFDSNGDYLWDFNSIRFENWRFKIYEDGSGELYDHSKDQAERDKLFDSPEYIQVIQKLKK